MLERRVGAPHDRFVAERRGDPTLDPDTRLSKQMSEPRLIHCHLNRRIRWHAAPINPQRLTPELYERSVDVSDEGEIEGLEPELWAMQVGFLFDRVHASRVGRVLISGVRRETIVYHGTSNQTFPDTLHGQMPEEAHRLARTTGAPAVMFLDLRRGPHRSVTGLPRNHEVSLAHELAHAVHVTWGCYAGSPYAAEDIERFHSPSPEETGAWIMENMFRVERRLPARRTYLGDAPLPPGEMPSDRTTGIPLAAAERTAAARLRRKAPSVAERLRSLPARECPYNPFR
mgnify:FL=1